MSRRQEKVAELVKRQLSDKLKEKLNPEFGIVTLTDVIITPDLKQADVYVSCLEKGKTSEVLKALNNLALEFQQFLGRNLKMRYTPKLEFKEDTSLEKINKVEEILKEIK